MTGRGTFLIVVADDFGKSSSVNRAVAEAHEKGIVTAASIMTGGDAFDEAVGIARACRRLSVGLHVTLCDGRSLLSRSVIPDLVDDEGYLEKSPSRAWIKYSGRRLFQQLDKEIGAQFDCLEKAGIFPTHVDSHHHLHMHPALFRMISKHAAERGVRWIRIPHEPLLPVRRFFTGRGAFSLIEWMIFETLGMFHSRTADTFGMEAAENVYGLSRTGHLDEEYLMGILEKKGTAVEIFAHPDTSTPAGRRELSALTSVAVRDCVVSRGIRLLGYRELNAEKDGETL